MKFQIANISKSLGPGLIFAGAAIGVSHLVQSTRAGADFGFGLLWALLLIHIVKYPFFQYGPKYTTATGESLIDGYKKLGKGVLWTYFALTFLTMFTIQAAVTIVTAGLAANLFGFTNNPIIWSIVITLVSALWLVIGRYKMLDKLMKLIIITLAISSIAAVLIALVDNDKTFYFAQTIPKGSVEIAFLIAFLGWMPAPLDIATWHSLWTIEKRKDNVQNFDTKQALFDFNIGYITTIFLGICFMALGALVMFHSSEEISSGSVAFAKQLINLYTVNLGEKSGILIGIAAFTTMFSTTLTTLDASPRAMAKTTQLIFNKKIKNTYTLWVMLLAIGTIIILKYFATSMLTMVKIATILSFLTAPFYAIANLTLINGKHTPAQARPSKIMVFWSYLGIVFLIGFSIWYLSSLF